MSPPTLQRLARLSLVPGICTALVLAAGQPATAQFASDFEDPPYMGSAGGTVITGQDNFYIPVPGSYDGLVYTYAGNALGLPANPSGGGKQFAGVTGGTAEPPKNVPFARAQRDVVYGAGTGVWTVSYDVAATFVGVLPSADNIGSFSTQVFTGEATYIALFTWTDPVTAANWDARYVWYNAGGAQLNEAVGGEGGGPGDPAFQGLAIDHWYRQSTTFNLDTNQILLVSITDLTTGVTITNSPSGRYLEGGAAGGTPPPTGFRLFGGAGAAGAEGNTLAFDNISIDLRPAPPLGACCLLDDSCVVLTEADCLAADGTYSGDGSGCTPITCVDIPPACGAKGSGDCGVDTGNPGCEDVECCVLVCNIDPFCCLVNWDQQCANIAINIGCAAGPGQPINLATGGDETADGYLRISTDGYGSWADPGFGNSDGDTYNPAGPDGPTTSPSFTNGFFIMREAAQERELLSTNDSWQDVGSDASMSRAITVSGEGVDTNADGVPDTRVSEFNVTSASGMDITIQLTQHVETVTPVGGDPVALVHFDMVITNNAGAVDFEFVRHMDFDLTFNGTTFGDDNVGTGTNGSEADRFIYQSEAVDGVADPVTSIVFSSPDGGEYYGGKGGGPVQEPCCTKDPDCPGYGAGTDVQVWDAYGPPACWANYIVNVGLNTDGDSDTAPGGDGFIGLAIPVSLAAEGVTTVSAMLTYGSTVPGGAPGGPPCPWDLDVSGVVGVADFLELLGTWGDCPPVGDCPADFDGSGDVGVSDFLKLLGNWGPCPS